VLSTTDDVRSTAAALEECLTSVVDGHENACHRVVTVLLAGGHLLLEDVPGVGKTVLAKTLARAVDGRVSRIQFTPDLLPTDVTGLSIFDQGTQELRFHPGPLFANVVIADEINRAPAKTQSALLEAMEERQVSADGTTRRLPSPFMVVATQNPWDLDGTYPLPEAQRDRFMARLSLGYPSAEAEARMLSRHRETDPLQRVEPVADASTIVRLQQAVTRVHVSDAVTNYLVALAATTREHPDVSLGVSPRGALQWMRLAQAEAAVCGRDFVTPSDVQVVGHAAAIHRLVLAAPDDARGSQASRVVDEALGGVPVPRG